MYVVMYKCRCMYECVCIYILYLVLILCGVISLSLSLLHFLAPTYGVSRSQINNIRRKQYFNTIGFQSRDFHLLDLYTHLEIIEELVVIYPNENKGTSKTHRHNTIIEHKTNPKV